MHTTKLLANFNVITFKIIIAPSQRPVWVDIRRSDTQHNSLIANSYISIITPEGLQSEVPPEAP